MQGTQKLNALGVRSVHLVNRSLGEKRNRKSQDTALTQSYDNSTGVICELAKNSDDTPQKLTT
jgi:hypothetical protein